MKKTKYSVLELATVGVGSTAAESFRRALDLARKAEKWGYERIWLAEHHNMLSIASSATAILIGHLAGGTSSIRVGSGGIMLPNHSPLIVAEKFATLASLYPGRIDLGLGRAPGTDEITARAIRQDRMHSVFRFPDEVSQVQRYFSPENSGGKVRVPFAEGLDMPVYILGSSPDSAHVAAARGLPYAFASHFAPAHLERAFAIYENEFTPSDQCEAPYKIGCVNIIGAETRAEAEKLATSLLQLMVGVVSGKPDYMHPPIEVSASVRALFQHPALARMLEFAFIGDPETIRDKTTDFAEHYRVDEVMAVSHIFDHDKRMNSFRIFAEAMKEINQTGPSYSTKNPDSA